MSKSISRTRPSQFWCWPPKKSLLEESNLSQLVLEQKPLWLYQRFLCAIHHFFELSLDIGLSDEKAFRKWNILRWLCYRNLSKAFDSGMAIRTVLDIGHSGDYDHHGYGACPDRCNHLNFCDRPNCRDCLLIFPDSNQVLNVRKLLQGSLFSLNYQCKGRWDYH